jgi:hypothetical protein
VHVRIVQRSRRSDLRRAVAQLIPVTYAGRLAFESAPFSLWPMRAKGRKLEIAQEGDFALHCSA